jgi:hypothetical protein
MDTKMNKLAAWACLVCGKLHPASDPHVAMKCLCDAEGWGHPDDHEMCQICRLDMLADMGVCRECDRPCNSVAGSVEEWNCCCTDECQAHHRNCGQGGYICQWCRDGNPECPHASESGTGDGAFWKCDGCGRLRPRSDRRTLAEVITTYEAETGKLLGFW